MISFVWSAKYPFYAGAGGSENYTAGHIRELARRGIPSRIITLGHSEDDGRKDFPDIQFLALDDKKQLSELDDTLIFITYPLAVTTKRPNYTILHCPPPSYAHNDPLYNLKAMHGTNLIATSKFASRMWRSYLGPSFRVQVVYPFAENDFACVERKAKTDPCTDILFAGRLTPDKGIYTLLASIHMLNTRELNYKLTVTTAGGHCDEGKIILPLVKAHPQINVVPARRNAKAMAELMASQDIVVMPSTDIFWREMFGIVSVEAQHAGCRVVAARSGGLPETNCGGLHIIKSDNPKALAQGLVYVAGLPPLTITERSNAANKYTVEKSVDRLLSVITQQRKIALPHADGRLLADLQPNLRLLGGRLKQSGLLADHRI